MIEKIKTISPEDYIKMFSNFNNFPFIQSKKGVVGFNIVKDKIIRLNKTLLKKIEKEKNEIFKVLSQNIIKEEDIEIPIYKKEEYLYLKKFFKEYIEEERYGGNAFFGYAVLRHIFKNIDICFNTTMYKNIKEINEIRTNYIIEYSKGLKIKEHSLTRDSRIILSDRTKRVKVYYPKTPEAEYFLLTGYHHIKKEGELYLAHKFIEKISKNKYVHSELSEFSNESFVERVIKKIYSKMTSIGMNSIEGEKYFDFDIKCIEEDSEKFAVKVNNTIVFIHDPSYTIVFIPRSIQITGILESIFFAQKIAIIKAAYDPYLKNPRKKWNKKSEIYIAKEASNLEFGIYKTKYHFIYLVPTILSKKIIHSVGLGDTLSASFSAYLFYSNIHLF